MSRIPPELGLGLADIAAAAERIEPWVHRTPVLRSHAVDEACRAAVHMKAEHLQRSGSFKARGAHNKMLSLSDGESASGVVAVSSGNHAGAVALAARNLGVRADVYMPIDAPELKRRAAQGYGATVHTFDRSIADRAKLARDHRDRHGSVVLEPYDDLVVMAGQGTLARELVEQAEIDVAVIPVSGGGLLAGCAVALRSLNPDVHIVGVEPSTADDTFRSMSAGKRIEVPAPQTIADGLAIPMPGALTFPIVRTLVDEIVTVDDADTAAAMVFLFERTKQVVEPSGAITLAAAMTQRWAGERVGVVLSGGNIGAERFGELTRPGRWT